ncbi:hypothetical protein ACCO44_11355 [Microbacterium maritypicum]|uniref:hypothetical protein n=1 Tax=Microbacterium maritypicum TaxID=33918 RepID=UPI003558896C
MAALLMTAVAALTTIGLTAPVGAQSVYGDSSVYGSNAYGAGAASESVLPPNTGFGRFVQNALEHPLLIWGSGMLLVAAVMVAIGRTKRRKQEN